MSDAALAAIVEDGAPAGDITVTLSNELVHLLSEQMYQSPLKAIEELVVNSYDADARQCRLSIPLPPADRPYLLVYDDGVGMTPDGLKDLWQIGRSNKRSEEIAKLIGRKQIGKFGIGKLATYSIAHVVTYISKTATGIHAVTMDFRDFAHDAEGGKPLGLTIRTVSDASLRGDEFKAALASLELEPKDLIDAQRWTLAVLEELKPKLGRIQTRGLKWVLSTAMPLKPDFKLFLNNSEVVSHKATFKAVARFGVHELPKARLDSHEATFGTQTRVEGDRIVSDTFPSGISGEVIITEQSLYGGKSSDLVRSHGFFVRVRDRLVEEGDPLFGLDPLSYSVFNRFRADIEADDLDGAVTASREGFEASDDIVELQGLLSELFLEARSRWEAEKKKREEDEKRKNESKRERVDKDLVEDPLADALSDDPYDDEYDDDVAGDDEWLYLLLPEAAERAQLIEKLYSGNRTRYTYSEREAGSTGPVVAFDPADSTFWINVEHPLVQAHDEPNSQPLLRDLLTSEVLLEVYLRQTGLSPVLISELLARRDSLFRSLADDHLTSVTAIAAQLRDSADDKYDLEINLVIAARAVGFVARHVGGAGNPDGVAKYPDYPAGEKKIILEAKSSQDEPGLGAIDFAGLAQHMKDEPGAVGCLLVAPTYPGKGLGDYAQAAKRAENLGISCWTVEQLARVVELSQARHISASEILAIVTASFTPDQVAAAVDALLTVGGDDHHALNAAVIDALRSLDGRMPDKARTVEAIATEITGRPDFSSTKFADIRRAVADVVTASQGILRMRDGRLILRGSYDELDRRAGSITGRGAPTRRASRFAADEDVP
ncbi:ATP-binding protein [Aquihabitans sp. McL0605]|uniref:ATP-binding protein n=1 Tax=Aquihabitans sp. McL0605 TaxID=3415671 RepID=UPI003CE8A138